MSSIVENATALFPVRAFSIKYLAQVVAAGNKRDAIVGIVSPPFTLQEMGKSLMVSKLSLT